MKKFLRLIAIYTVLAVMVFSLATPVFAQPTTPPTPPPTTGTQIEPNTDPATGLPIFNDFWQFLAWAITGPGLVILVGAFVSTVLAKLEWWNGLSGDIKSLVTIALPFVFLIPGVLLATHFGVIVAADVPNKMLTALLFYFSTQITYGKLQAADMVRYPGGKKPA